MSNADKPAVVTTRWWWVRHAPVRSDGGNIYGQKDIACDTSDRHVFEAVAKILPRQAVWVASSLQRTHQTAQAIWDTGFPKPAMMAKEAAFAEQHLGQWQGMNRAAFLASRPAGSHWFADIGEPPFRPPAVVPPPSAPRRRAAKALWICTTASVARSVASMPNTPAMT
jgi:alpha-ribazole phosphatase